MQTEEQKLVNDFASKMLAKIELRHDRYSALGWKTLDMKRILWLLEGELNEIREVLNSKDIGNALVTSYDKELNKGKIEDCAVDLANYALFIHEISK